jgi:phosphate:Na+ symporter
VQEALFLSSLEVGKHIDTFPIFFGFGLLFIGLSFMKTAMEAQVKVLIFHYATMSLAVYLLIGFMITVVVQSSSVTMALTLSALHVSAISLPIAAIILGSQTGTTIKIMLGYRRECFKSESY